MHLTRASLFTTAGAAALLLLHGAPQAAGQDIRNERLKIVADDGDSNDYFAWAVSISGSTAIVGAYGDDDNGSQSGSAYLFDVATGTLIAKLFPRDATENDYFGETVAISGTTAIVGAAGNDDNGSDSGSAYLFDVATGTQLAKWRPSDGARNDYFGGSVAISGPTAMAGAQGDDDNGKDSGSAYLFNVTAGTTLAKLLPDDGAAEDRFGRSVAISGTIALAGAYADDDNGKDSGSAYLFDVNTGRQIAKLLASDGETYDRFGESVAISRTTAIVGAYGDDDNWPLSGAAYLFDATTGTQIAKLLPDDGAEGDQFGYGVAISGTIAIVGASRDDDNWLQSGSAYLFDATTGTQIAKLLPTDGTKDDQFGLSVGISGTTAIVGAWGDEDDLNLVNSGAAYLFDLEGGTPFSVAFSGDCPGQGTFTVADATPGGGVLIVSGFSDGPVTIPNVLPCARTILDVGNPWFSTRIITADANGVAVLNTNLPPAACNQLRVQALDLTTCEVSEVVRP